MLVLHSWWGLTGFFRRLADRISDLGYTVLVPDLNVGEAFAEADDARRHLADADADHLARLTLSSAVLLQERALDRSRPIGVVGFSMGASLGLWASARLPQTIGAVVAFYGTQSIDFAGSRAAYQLHLADLDDLVSDDDAAFLEATLALEGLAIDVHHYPGTSHWFFEEGREQFAPAAAALAWDRLVAFLGAHL